MLDLDRTQRTLRILGTRGIPARHGGFETFAQHLALYLTERGWDVTVYCQDEGVGAIVESYWRGVRCVHIPVRQCGAAGTIVFDWKSTLHACKETGLVLTLGYNTAIFCLWYRLHGLTNLINMDGIEWRRQKWGPFAKAWCYCNEWCAAWLANHLVADHPEIKQHLTSRVNAGKITTVAYGADCIDDADPGLLQQFGLLPDSYALIVARPEPENSVLDMVRAWSRTPRGMPLVVLGNYADDEAYHCRVRQAASEEVIFPGAIYDVRLLAALRFHARLYLHGHQVGGTNPSLVEALAAGNAVLAHDNPYNRFVAGAGARFFKLNRDGAQARADLPNGFPAGLLDELLTDLLDDHAALAAMRTASRARHADAYTWERILGQYEALLLDYLPVRAGLDWQG